MLLPRRLVRRLGSIPRAAGDTRPRGPAHLALDLFTDRARDAVTLAQVEARQLNHNYIGTEHVLLGLVQGDGVAAQILRRTGIRPSTVRAAVESIVGRGPGGLGGPAIADGERCLTPRLKLIFDLAVKEAAALGHGYVGTEHLLLGIAREGEGVAARILSDVGVTAENVRDDLLRIVGPDPR